jgi:ankyrin repeat protein
MYVLHFHKDWWESKPHLTLSFKNVHEEVEEVEATFKANNVLPNIGLTQVGDYFKRYEISASSWERIFQLLSVYLVAYVHPENTEEYLKWSKEAAYALNQLPDAEAQQYKSLYDQLMSSQIVKYHNLQQTWIKLNTAGAKFQLATSVSIPSASAGENLETVVNANESLALANQRLFQEVIKAAREKCEQYNSLAVRASQHVQESNGDATQLKKYLPPEQTFELQTDLNTTGSEKEAAILNEKIDHLLNEISACQAIMGDSEVNEQSELEVLYHKYSSFQSPLIWIIHDKDLPEAKKLALADALAEGKPLNGTVRNLDIACGEPKYANIYERQPLTHAAESGSAAMVKLLLEKKPNINATPPHDYRNPYNDKTALHVAAKRGDPAIVELLLQHSADVNALDEDGETPLHKVSSVKCTELLLAYGANPNAGNKKGDTPLHVICRKQLKINKSQFDFSMEKHLQKRGEHLALISLLINKGAQINQLNTSGCTPLYYAVDEYCDSDVDHDYVQGKVLLLCEQHADVNLAVPPGSTALLNLYNDRYCHVGKKIRQQRLEIAKILVAHGALNKEDNHGRTIFHKIIKEPDLESLKFFLSLPQALATINTPDKHSLTPLHDAAWWGTRDKRYKKDKTKGVKIIQLLLEHGANPFCKARCDDRQVTPYEYAILFQERGCQVGPDTPELKLIKEWEKKLAKYQKNNLPFFKKGVMKNMADGSMTTENLSFNARQKYS